MTTAITEKTPLIIIDMQVGFDEPYWGKSTKELWTIFLTPRLEPM